MTKISPSDLAFLKERCEPLIGAWFEWLTLPVLGVQAFEPSQIGTIVGTLMDAMIPHLPDLPQLGLAKHEGILGDREGYPDYMHTSGKRLELKLLYIDNPAVQMKKPPTPREPSARLSQKVTVKNVDAARDALLLIAYRIEPKPERPEVVVPRIVDLEIFSMIDVIEARDRRLMEAGGRWFGHFETPAVLSKRGRQKRSEGIAVDETTYGRKESEGKDFNEDTNFGKLKRIPHAGLQAFLRKHRIADASSPQPSMEAVTDAVEETLEELESET